MGKDNEKFRKWLDNNQFNLDARLLFKDITYPSYEESVPGVIASDMIEKDEKLFEINYSNILSIYNTSCPCLDQLEYSNWIQVVVAVGWEWHLKEKSHWYEYLHHFLPIDPEKKILNEKSPLFWEEKYQELLKGTESYYKLIQQKNQLEDDWKNVETVLKKNTKKFQEFTGIFTKNLFMQILFIVSSYSFTLPPSESILSFWKVKEELEEDIICMVPMADALNHQTGKNNARLFADGEEDESEEEEDDDSDSENKKNKKNKKKEEKKRENKEGVEMCSIKRINKGEEVFNTYGDLSNSELLIKYGFIDQKNENDYVTFSFDDIISESSFYYLPDHLHELFLDEFDTRKNPNSSNSGKKRSNQSDLDELKFYLSQINSRLNLFENFVSICGLEEQFTGPEHVFGFCSTDEEVDPIIATIIQFISAPDSILDNIIQHFSHLSKEFDQEMKEGCHKIAYQPPASKIQKTESSSSTNVTGSSRAESGCGASACCNESDCNPADCSACVTPCSTGDGKESSGGCNNADCSDEECCGGEEDDHEGGEELAEDIFNLFNEWKGKEKVVFSVVKRMVTFRENQYATLELDSVPPYIKYVCSTLQESEKAILQKFLLALEQ